VESRLGNWIRTEIGWLPLLDSDGHLFFNSASASEAQSDIQLSSPGVGLTTSSSCRFDFETHQRSSDLTNSPQVALAAQTPRSHLNWLSDVAGDESIDFEMPQRSSDEAKPSQLSLAVPTVESRANVGIVGSNTGRYAPFAKLSTCDVFVITYSEDWGVVLEEHLCQLRDRRRDIQDFVVTDRDGFEVDIACSDEVPGPCRFPLRFVYRGLADFAAEQQCQQLDCANGEEIIADTHLMDLALRPPVVPLQRWEADKLQAVATQVLTALQSGRYTEDFGQILLKQFHGWRGDNDWAQAEQARVASLVLDCQHDPQKNEELQRWIKTSLLSTLREIEKEVNRGLLAGLEVEDNAAGCLGTPHQSARQVLSVDEASIEQSDVSDTDLAGSKSDEPWEILES